MNRRVVRAAAALAALVLAGLAGLGGAAAARAAAAPVGDCTTTSGVIVAVDFAHWGGPVLRGCGTTPTTAYTLLNQGGWHTTGTQHDGPGFICRIGYAGFHGGTQYPTPAEDPCVLTPPTSAYWAFWYASPGQSTWSYSQTGAEGVQPAPGSVELWVFGGTNVSGTTGSAVPAISPVSLRATNLRSEGTVQKKAAQPTTGPARQTTPASPDATPTPTRTRAVAGTGATPSGRATIVNAPPAAASTPVSHGSATPAIIALVLVLVLAAVGITVVLRRPRRDQ